MKTAYSYIRWSTVSQGDSGRDSRQRQTSSAERWIAEHGNGEYTLSKEVFIDAGKSSHSGKHIEIDEYGRARGQLMRFIQLVEESTIEKDSVLLIDSFDRFSRLLPTKSLTLFMQVIDSGVGLVFTGSHEKRVINSELLNKEGYVLQFIIGEMIRSHSESAEKSRKVKSAKQEKKDRMRKGEIVAHNNIPKYFTFDKGTGQYIHNDNTSIVRDLVNGLLSGKSLYAMAGNLNAKKVKTFRRGFQWSGNSIRVILKNRTLIGEYLGNKGFVPAIINEDVFEKVQSILLQNVSSRGKRGDFVNIFRGLCFCADCGKSMSLSVHSYDYKRKKPYNSTYRYLRCSVTGKHVECKNRKVIRLPDMETAFFYEFLVKTPPEFLADGSNAESLELDKAISSAALNVNRISSNITKVIAALEGVSSEELKTKLVQLGKERNIAKAELDKLNLTRNKITNTPSNRVWMVRISRNAWDGKEEEHTIYTDTLTSIHKSLKNNEEREQIRIKLPTLISKLTVDTNKGQFFVYNHMGKRIFESSVIKSHKNCSQAWLESLKRPKTAS